MPLQGPKESKNKGFEQDKQLSCKSSRLLVADQIQQAQVRERFTSGHLQRVLEACLAPITHHDQSELIYATHNHATQTV